ncbi:hypothetical protein ACFLSQ_06670 [Bacteroidota bacterium]
MTANTIFSSPGRYWQSGDYRYGFNSMEKDDEIKGTGNSLDFGAVFENRKCIKMLFLL